MKSGRTIAGERESVISDSERMEARRKQRNRKIARGAMVGLMVAVVGWLMVSGVLSFIDLMKEGKDAEVSVVDGYDLAAEIVDEAGAGVTESMRKFVAQMEGDLGGYGYRLVRAVLPQGKMRQVNLYIEGKPGYVKVRSDRGAGEQAEDADRMLRYLSGAGNEGWEYVDVRTVGKGYFK